MRGTRDKFVDIYCQIMHRTVLTVNPTTDAIGTHDPSAAIFRAGDLVFGVEEERFTRRKHAFNTFPSQAIQACLDHCGIELSDVDKILIGWEPRAAAKYNCRKAIDQPNIRQKVYQLIQNIKDYTVAVPNLERKFGEIGEPVPPIETRPHHRCHAASAFFPSGLEQALVLTLDGRGEKESTVVWYGDDDGLERLRTYPYPNSLGGFYSSITAYLGFRPNNGEGKVMGLAPYGTRNQEVEAQLRTLIDTGVEYDVSGLNHHVGQSVGRLESVLGKPRKETPTEFTDWEKDVAHVAQKLLEDTVVDIVETYCQKEGLHTVCLAGGVALNCKVNKRVMELPVVDDLFVQPVAHDAGVAVGAGMLETQDQTETMQTVYWGPKYTTDDIIDRLDECKLGYIEPDDLERHVAERLADGELVGWFQGRLEMGPRALGNRSILADSRTVESRDRVNEFVKHREEWRPFAPTLLEEAVDEYLINGEPAPYMIKTFDVKNEKQAEIPAVLHPADDTTRPQTVREDQNPRYYNLLKEFEAITGVPVILNTSFNDHGEPIVNRPVEAIKDFFGMGLDILVLEDIVVDKAAATTSADALQEDWHKPV